MQNIILSKSNKQISGTVNLTGSKSECNRALVIEALSNGKVRVENVSDAADAVLLAGILRKNQESRVRNQEVLADGSGAPLTAHHSPLTTVDIGPAGTAMRFLTAYYAIQDDEVILTGSQRMKERPIGVLVNALRELGAHIDYEEKDG